MTTPGNHESFYNWTAFNNRYKMPQNGNENFWFSFDYGNVHTVSLSTEHCFDADCEQMIWLKSDLERARSNRQTTPWIVVSMHRPVYCSEEGHVNVGGAYQTLLEPVFLQYDVDLVLQGHVHAYERIHPLQNGIVTVLPSTYRPSKGERVDLYHSEGKGPVYVVQGNTGAMQFERWTQPQPEWSALRFANGFIPPRDVSTTEGSEQLQGLILQSNYTDTFGLGIATFANSTHLHYEVIPVSGTIGVDEFWIVKREA
jgi:acid phosphatase type 7